ILSNNHVLANSNDAQIGDMILQPGSADGGTYPADMFAALYDFVPINFNQDAPTCSITKSIAKLGNAAARAIGSAHRLDAFQVSTMPNYVDAALACPLDPQDLDDEIIGVGKVIGMMVNPKLGEKVCKSGRTTGYTNGEITLLDLTVSVNYGGGKVATFMDQIGTTNMSAPGDSGSLGVMFIDQAPYAFGLLFAGSDKITIYNPIKAVADALNITF
ncbi:unnamed protein product, partial [marine sediment metagenome]